MKPLPDEFFKYGDHFQKVFREGNVALFKRTSPTRRVSWEVIIVQSHDGREAFGASIPPAEYYPSTGSWGTLGWSFMERHDADERVNGLCIRFGTRKPIPARRRSLIPLLVPGGRESKHEPTLVVELQTLQSVAKGDQSLGPRQEVTGPELIESDIHQGEATTCAVAGPDTGADPIGDGTFKMHPSGDIVSLAERNARLARFAQSPKPLNCQEQAREDQPPRQRLPHDERGWQPT